MKTRHNPILLSSLRAALLLILTAGMMQMAGAANVLWTGAGGNQNWSTGGNWSGGTPTGNDLFFGDAGSGATNVVNSVVDVNTVNANSMTFTNDAFSISPATGKYHTIQIGTGITLNNTNNLVVGVVNTATAFPMVWVGIVGSGSLVQKGNTFTVCNSTTGAAGSASGSTNAILDMSGLSNFVWSASGGTLKIAGSGSGEARGSGILYLAQTNSITVGTITMAMGTGNGGNGASLYLGSATNAINVGTLNMAGGKANSATLKFLTSAGSLRLRGTGGTDADRVNMTLGNHSTSGTGVPTGTIDFSGGHFIDVKAGTVTLGQANQNTAGQNGVGSISYDAGVFDATTINLASPSSAGAANGTVSVGTSGILIVNSMSLVNQTGAGAGTGVLIATNGGSVICSNNMVKTTSAGTGTVIVTNSSTLKLLGGTLGTAAIPIDTVTVNGTTLQLAVANSSTNIVATTFNDGGVASTVNISSLPSLVGYPTQFPLVKYGTLGGGMNLTLGTLPGTYTGYISNDAVAVIWLVVTNGPALPKITFWQGTVSSGDWDTTTANWTNSAGTAVNYNEGDFVTLDDSAATNVVNLPATRSPGGFTNNSTSNYTLVGSGGISSSGPLVKQGSGTLIVDNSGNNTFSGGINVSGGAVQFGNSDANGSVPAGNIVDNGSIVFARTDSNTVANVISGGGSVTQAGSGTNALTGNSSSFTGNVLIKGGSVQIGNTNALGSWASGTVTITNGGTLNLSSLPVAGNGNALFGAKQFYIAGGGIGGNGAIVDNGANAQQGGFQNITLTANATIGGATRWDMRNGSPKLDLNGFTLTKEGANQMSMVGLVVTNGGNIVINNGILSFETTSTFVNGSPTITVNAGGVLGHFRELAGLFTAPIVLNGGMIRDLNGTPGSTNDSPITLTADSFLDLNVGSTDLLRLNGAISESGGSYGLTKTNVGSFSLAATNIYSGNTRIVQGKLLLVDNGSIANSANIIVSGGATFDVAALLSTFSLASGQILSNSAPATTATINGAANTGSGTVSLAYTNGTPSFNVTGGALTLSSGTTFKVANTGPALASGNYKIISKGSGSVAGSPLPAVTIGGSGIASGQHASLNITGAELFLVVTNHAPVANPVTNTVSAGLTWKIATSALAGAAGWSDPDGDTVTFVSAAPTSTLGTNVTVSGGFIFYGGPVTANDAINYVISDGTLTTTQTVFLVAQASPPHAQANGTDVNNHPTLNGSGIPNFTYGVEMATNIAGPWSVAGYFTAGTDGYWGFTDTNVDVTTVPGVFYRTYWPTNTAP